MGHGIDPQAVNEGKDTAKDIAKTKRKTKVVDFLDKVDSRADLFPQCSRIDGYPNFIAHDFFNFSWLIHNGDNQNM